MDPDAALAELRQLAREHENDPTPSGIFAEYVQALDEWLAKGGFLPHRWTAAGGLTQGMRYFVTWTDEDDAMEIVATGTREDLHDLIAAMKAGEQCWSALVLVEKLDE